MISCKACFQHCWEMIHCSTATPSKGNEPMWEDRNPPNTCKGLYAKGCSSLTQCSGFRLLLIPLMGKQSFLQRDHRPVGGWIPTRLSGMDDLDSKVPESRVGWTTGRQGLKKDSSHFLHHPSDQTIPFHVCVDRLIQPPSSSQTVFIPSFDPRFQCTFVAAWLSPGL